MTGEVVSGEVMRKGVQDYLAGLSGNLYRIGSTERQPLGPASYRVETDNGMHKVMIHAIMLDTLSFTAKEDYGLLLTKNDNVKLEISEGEKVVKEIDADKIDIDGIPIKAGQTLRFVRKGSGYIGSYSFFMNEMPELELNYVNKTPEKAGTGPVDPSKMGWDSFI